MFRIPVLFLVAVCGFAQVARLDPKRLDQAFQASRKLIASTREGEASWYYWQGRAYSRVPGEKDRHLFNVLGMSVRTSKDLVDPEKGRGFRLLSREVMLYLDPKTGEILHHWDNPFTGQRVEVLQVANDPVNPPPSWEREPGQMGLSGTFHGGMYLHQVCVPLFYPDPLGGGFQHYVGGQYQALEVFNFAVPEDDLLDAHRTGARSVTISWMRVSKWMPWMAMGDRPGQMIFNALGSRVERFEDLPDPLRQEIEAHYPQFKTPPPLDDRRPTETSWTAFKRYKEASLQAPAAAAPNGSRGSLTHLTELMTGHFSSAEQAKQDPENYRDIRLEVARVWPERKDGVWLYVEQAAATSLDKPYRQRVYHITALPDGRYCSVIQSFKGDPLVHAGAWKNAEPLKDLKAEDLEALKGCAVYLAYDGKGMYQGGTRGQECENKWRGASYATSEVTITAAEMRSWDRGYDPASKQIWGAEKGGYIFKKLGER